MFWPRGLLVRIMPKLCSKDCTLLLIPLFSIQNRSKQYVEGKLWRVQRRSCGADGSHEGQIIAKSGGFVLWIDSVHFWIESTHLCGPNCKRMADLRANEFSICASWLVPWIFGAVQRLQELQWHFSAPSRIECLPSHASVLGAYNTALCPNQHSWPSGLRRYVQVVFLIGEGSNPSECNTYYCTVNGV